jgi:ethanolamine utilization protein EutN
VLIGRVIGEVVATQKHASHEARQILVVQPLDLDGSDRGCAVVALDSVGAGIGDKVLVTTDGWAAFTALGLAAAPIDMAVIGVVDRLDLSVELGFAMAPPPPGAQ